MVIVKTLQIESPSELDDITCRALAELLVDCVEGGASVGFMPPLSAERAMTYWDRVADEVRSRKRAILVASDRVGVVGTVQLVLEQPENQPHRADLVKLLVHRRARRLGVATALMEHVEELARSRGKSLLVLDAVSGGPAARLYAQIGWEAVGDIPGYALNPDGSMCSTTYFYRRLAAR